MLGIHLKKCREVVLMTIFGHGSGSCPYLVMVQRPMFKAGVKPARKTLEALFGSRKQAANMYVRPVPSCN
jgi:hypothetical protein